MNTFFLPREVGSIETGAQNFLRAGNVPFVFQPDPALQDVPGLLNSVQVSNAGWNNLNGIFSYTFLFEGKPYYNKDGNSNWFILWFNNQWQIYDFSQNNIDPIYFSTEDVLYPWNVVNWQSLPGFGPAPLVTKIL